MAVQSGGLTAEAGGQSVLSPDACVTPFRLSLYDASTASVAALSSWGGWVGVAVGGHGGAKQWDDGTREYVSVRQCQNSGGSCLRLRKCTCHGCLSIRRINSDAVV